MKRWRHQLFCGTALVVLGASFSASAQRPAGATEEIVVTAQRRAEALENVPMSVVAVSPERLEKAGIVGMQDLNRVAVGTQLNFGGAFFMPSIRGISTLTNGNQAENNVGVYVDGFYDPGSITLNMDLSNLEGIQVLKGPQGTLYGRNATGGAILVNTLGPTKHWTGKLDAQYGRFDDKAFTGHLSGPINDRTRFSLSGYYRQSPGYLKLISPTVIGRTIGISPSAEVKKQNIRAKLEVDLTDDLTAQLGYSWGYTQDNRVNNYANFEYPSTLLQTVAPPPLRPTVPGTVGYNFPSFQFSIRNQGSLKLVWKTGIGTLTSLTGYTEGIDKAQFDFDATYAQLTGSVSKYRDRTFQQSLDYNIDAIENLDLLLGGLYYDDKLYTVQRFTNPAGVVIIGNAQYSGPAVVSINQNQQRTKSWAIYIDATYHLNDRVAITAGGRYSNDRKAYVLTSRNYAGVITLNGGQPFSNSVKWTKFTPRVNVRYELAPKSNLYVGWQRGFRNGNFNGSGPPLGFPFIPNRPESIDSFEIGFKTAQADFRLETAAFYYIYKDIQTNIVVPAPTCPAGSTCGASNFFSNGPGAKVYGIDIEATWNPTDVLEIHAGAEYLHARYDRFPNASGTGLFAANLQNTPSAVVQDWSGKRLARAPDFTANLGVDYTIPTESSGSFRLSANVNYTTKFANNNASLYDVTSAAGVSLEPAGLHGKQRYEQKAHALVNASVTWTSADDHYYIKAYGNNLTNKFLRLNYNGSSFGDYGTRAEPITYGGKIGVRF